MFFKVLCICFLFLARPSQQSLITANQEIADFLKLERRSAPEECKDDNASCSWWATIGECKVNPGYMLQSCRKSCRVCGSDNEENCKDDHATCPERAKTGECTANPLYMLKSCRKSCKICGPDSLITTGQTSGCKDDSLMCSWWARKGECKANPGYMLKFCRKSCKVCNCDVQHGDSCFWFIKTKEWNLDYQKSVDTCKEAGGQIADIYDQQHYDAIMTYLRPKIYPPIRHNFEVWLGTKFNQKTNVAYDKNGNEAFGKWFPGHPYSQSSFYSAWTGVRLLVDRDPSNKKQGMMTGRPEWYLYGVLCEHPTN